MTTQQIHFFLELARTLSFTRAAKNLYISQPTLSKQIASMENELGFQLFYRKGKNVSLTPAGSLMRIELEKTELSLKNALEQARRLKSCSEGHFSCAVLDMIDPELYVLPIINAFRQSNPFVELELVVCGFQEIRRRLAEKRIDVAFTKHFELYDIANVSSIPVCAVTPSVLLPAAHPLANEKSLTISRLKEEAFVILELDECPAHTDAIVQMCIKEGFYPKIAKYANNNLSRILYVHEGCGVALMDGETALPSWADIAVVPMCSDIPSLRYDTFVVLAWHQESANPLVDVFVNIAKDMVDDLSAAGNA